MNINLKSLSVVSLLSTDFGVNIDIFLPRLIPFGGPIGKLSPTIMYRLIYFSMYATSGLFVGSSSGQFLTAFIRKHLLSLKNNN